MAEIEIKTELRPCYANGKKALFHKWFEHHYVINPGITIGNNNGGEETKLYAVVEFEDGTVEFVLPREIVFADSEFKKYAFQPPSEKGAGND